MTRTDVQQAVEGDVVHVRLKDGADVHVEVLGNGCVDVRVSPAHRDTAILRDASQKPLAYRCVYDKVDVVSTLQASRPCLTVRVRPPSDVEHAAAVAAMRGEQSFAHSLPVCPPCASGHHEHHRGEDGDCKNLIPEGQCHCYTGAARKPGREMPKESM